MHGEGLRQVPSRLRDRCRLDVALFLELLPQELQVTDQDAADLERLAEQPHSAPTAAGARSHRNFGQASRRERVTVTKGGGQTAPSLACPLLVATASDLVS